MNELRIHFGANIHWELPADDCIASFLDADAEVVQDLAAEIDTALSRPLEFPSLDQAVVPGDKLVLALDPTVPSLGQVSSLVAAWFRERGSDPANMRVVLADIGQAVSPELVSEIREGLPAETAIERHDADDAQQLAYVAANDASDPIYMNRSMVDADVVIPISCARPASTLDYLGAYSLFPLLSDRTTRGKFFSLPSLCDPVERDKLHAWADQAAWWVGLVAGIQIIPAGRDQVAKLLSGQLEPLELAVQLAMAAAWKTQVTNSDLVVALVDGSQTNQTWLGMARALHTAAECCAQGGTIVICTQLSEPVGKGLGRLRNPNLSHESIAKQLSKDAHDDALAAAMILQTTANHHVYLVSNLSAETVEGLGLGVINDVIQLTRLIEQHQACTILGSAQHRWLEPVKTLQMPAAGRGVC